MSSETWKLEKDLCRCCHSEGDFKNLAEPYATEGKSKMYADILKECLEIDLTPVPGLLCMATYTICDACSIRLRDAVDFKKQVLDCEERFQDMYNRNCFSALTYAVNVDVKEELSGAEDDRVEFVPQIQLTIEDSNSSDLQINDDDDEDYIAEPEGKKRKCKPRKSMKTKQCKKAKRKTETVTLDDDDEEKKQGPPKYYTITDDNYKCNVCTKIYSSQPLVSQHYRFVHLKRRPKDRKCPKCDERIPDYLRTAHLEKEHGIPAPSCGVCGKKFRFPCNVIQHQKKVHMGEKTEKCPICEKSFFNKLCLKLHMSTHSAVKKFKCSVCDREFRWENNLKDHLRIHTGDRRFVCTVCEKAFVQKSTLKQHVARNHPGVGVP